MPGVTGDIAAQAARDLERLVAEGLVFPFGDNSYFVTVEARALLRRGLVPEDTWIDARKRGAQADDTEGV